MSKEPTDGVLKEIATKVACLDCSRFLVTIVSFGFLFLTLDSFLEHYFTQREIRLYQWIPIIFGGIAFPISLAALVRLNPITSKMLGAVSLLSMAVGGLGFYFHVSAIWGMIDTPFEWSYVYDALRYGPPMLAPLSFGGLGLLGLVAAVGPSQLINYLSKELCGKDFSVYQDPITRVFTTN